MSATISAIHLETQNDWTKVAAWTEVVVHEKDANEPGYPALNIDTRDATSNKGRLYGGDPGKASAALLTTESRLAVHVNLPFPEQVVTDFLRSSQPRLVSERFNGCEISGRPDGREGRSGIIFSVKISRIEQSATYHPPFGFRGQLRFTIRLNISMLGATTVSTIDANPIGLEFYVVDRPPRESFPSGVPVLLLRMFVLAAAKQQIHDESDWVSLVTRICHGTAKPFTADSQDTWSHWLRYDSYGGTSSFCSSERGGDFQLDAWLNAYRNWCETGVLTTVNCYDQAGIVQVALSVGMDPVKVAWEYHQPFGFINNTSLVGWGPCNNPYFGDNLAAMNLAKQDSPDRYGFKNHVFLSWSSNFNRLSKIGGNFDPDTSSELLVIDACAGPHLGNETHEQYYAQKDRSYPTEGYGAERMKIGKDNPHSELYNGITGFSSNWDVYTRFDNHLDKDRSITIDWDELRQHQGDQFKKVFGTTIWTFQKRFKEVARNAFSDGKDWIDVGIPDIDHADASRTKESKLQGPDKLRFISIKFTVVAAEAENQREGAMHVMARGLGRSFDELLRPRAPSKEVVAGGGSSKENAVLLGWDNVVFFLVANVAVEVSEFKGYGREAWAVGRTIAAEMLQAPLVQRSEWKIAK